mmetsp:Transcript_20140/g.49404  ORF Transcript_20140/g.49404 Transcript_20140/m.49404 type:complete len:168 (-) Transcript_20140:148-651(-)
MSNSTEACTKDYCLCNPEFSIDQECPFETFLKTDCQTNVTTTFNETVLTMLCIRLETPSYPHTNCVIQDGGAKFTRVHLSSNSNTDEESSILWSCETGETCVERIPPCNSIVVSDSPTLAPSTFPTVPSPIAPAGEPTTSSAASCNPTTSLLLWLFGIMYMVKKWAI